jgi:hypothetical protein
MIHPDGTDGPAKVSLTKSSARANVLPAMITDAQTAAALPNIAFIVLSSRRWIGLCADVHRRRLAPDRCLEPLAKAVLRPTANELRRALRKHGDKRAPACTPASGTQKTKPISGQSG